MTWVRLDDRFPSHRKVALLSDRAFRLYVSALCWSSEQLTEGEIRERELPVIARLRGAKAAAGELEAAGLWDRTEVGWVIHDYLDYNPDRARVQADRAANAARQQAFRDRRKATRDDESNAVTPKSGEQGNDATATATRHDGDTNARETDLANQSSPQVSENRNAVTNGTPGPAPSQASPTEKPASRNAATSGPQIPDFATDLVAQMLAAGMDVGWGLSDPEWFAVHAHIKRCGIPRLVDHARRRWNPADPPRTARYLTRVWADLADAPADGTPRLRPVADEPKTRAQAAADFYRTAAQKG